MGLLRSSRRAEISETAQGTALPLPSSLRGKYGAALPPDPLLYVGSFQPASCNLPHTDVSQALSDGRYDCQGETTPLASHPDSLLLRSHFYPAGGVKPDLLVPTIEA